MDCRTQLASMAGDELDRGDFLMATKILNTSIILEPDNWKLYLDRSICHRNLGHYQASLDDANFAIRLNSSDHDLHYQKGLALIGLSLFPEAVTSFKKAIELRAKQEDTKLSDIFKLLKGAIEEMNLARRPGNSSNPTATEPSSSSLVKTTSNTAPSARKPTRSLSPVENEVANVPSKAIVDTRQAQQDIEQQSNNRLSGGAFNENEKSNAISNTNLVPECNQTSTGAKETSSETTVTTNMVAPIASQFQDSVTNNNLPASSYQLTRDTAGAEIGDLISNGNQLCKPSKSSTTSSNEWNIRRSERIFLHGSNELGTSGSHQEVNGHDVASSKLKVGSIVSSVSSSRGQKRSSDHIRDAYQPSKATKSKTITSSQVESDIDVDDSNFDSSQANYDLNANSKRVMVTPSSSMPATSQTPASTKEDSYSSKYKRLRRDRERARRGTSKLCTIKISDLDDLCKSRNSMRVIAPIDGWLYSGKLSVDGSFSTDGLPQYVVKLDGDSSGSSFLFTQSTVLNDVIKEVKVKRVSELRKGARICCYWSRVYKCLSTGVVTSRTFEERKSLVSVKYDNGDLSAVPLEDLRLLPPDYPKYMSSCDPLLLAKSGESEEGTISNGGTNRIVVNGISTSTSEDVVDSEMPVKSDLQKDENVHHDDPAQPERVENAAVANMQDHLTPEFDEQIPPTNKAIEFLTRDDDEIHHLAHEADEEAAHESPDHHTRRVNSAQIMTSRASSEENNYGIEYRPWVPEGPPKRTKRNGRTYRDSYPAIKRGHEVLRVGDSAELMPRDESILPFIAKIDGIWTNSRGEMRVRVRWYYRLVETEGAPYELEDSDNALFETDHFDENDVQSIWRATKILSWTDYRKEYLGQVNKASDGPKIFYLAGYYDPVRCVKHLRSDVKSSI